MTDDRVSITFLPTLDQYLRITAYLTIQGWLNKFFLLLFPLAGLLLLLLHTFTEIRTTPFDVFTIFLALSFVPGLIFITASSSFKRNKGQPTTLHIDGEGISGTGKNSMISHQWPGITKIKRTQNFLLLHFTDRCAYFAPLEIISDEQISQILSFAEANKVTRVGI